MKRNKKIKNTERKTESIVIYKGARGNVELKADFLKETVWATQAQLAELFSVDQSVVSRHIRNVVNDKEVDKKSNMQKMHIANSDKPVTLYSLDLILAVGYRANSSKAIKFRQWATKILREYILKGVVVNANRIQKLHEKGIQDLREKIVFIQNTIQKRELSRGEVNSLLAVISDYANSWLLLKKYDEGNLPLRVSKTKEKKHIEYDFARQAVDELKSNLVGKGEAGELFGNERDETFKGILKTIYQAFDGKELYPSVEEKAAHLLYFIIKDHPFTDGNKRVGSLLFILFLSENGVLFDRKGQRKISDVALTALALLVAESNPDEKDAVIALITNLIV